MKNNIVLFLLILLICSCEKQRLLNVPFANADYVVNGLFGKNKNCVLEISQSQYLNDTSRIKNVSSAKVSLYEEGQLIEKLEYFPPVLGDKLGSYIGEYKNFISGKEYSISVAVNEDKLIIASDIIPITQAAVSNFKGQLLADAGSKELKFDIDLIQSSSDKQFYHLILQQRWVEYAINPSDTNLKYDPWFNEPIYPEQHTTGFITTPSEPFSLSAGGNLQGIMLDNQNFVGLTKLIRFTASKSPQQSPNSYLESRVILRSVSENYFKFYYSSSQYYRTKGIPLTEPVIIHNNITNGLGNFSGYFSDTSAVLRTSF